MATITIEPKSQTEPVSETKSADETIEELIQRLAREGIANGARQIAGVAYFDSRPQLTHEEFARRLRALADGPPVPSLPADFSRADIYDDHD